jgi:hypothetical protein
VTKPGKIVRVKGACDIRNTAMNNCGDGGLYVRMDRCRAWIEGIPGVSLS